MAFVICSGILLVLGVLIGNRAGAEAGERASSTRQYWLLNLAVLAALVIVIAVLGLFQLLLFEALAMGLAVGAIAGLKFGFGESVGPWKTFDRYFNVNRAHRDAASSGAGERRRARRRAGEAPPDVISVAPEADDGREAASDAPGGKRAKRK